MVFFIKHTALPRPRILTFTLTRRAYVLTTPSKDLAISFETLTAPQRL
jgi:hypothetical protein